MEIVIKIKQEDILTGDNLKKLIEKIQGQIEQTKTSPQVKVIIK